MKNKYQKIYSISGILGPILITFIMLILAFYHENYNHITQYISELGAINAPNGYIMNIGFLILGILLILFGLGLYNNLINKNYKCLIKTGALLILLSGISFILICFFPCDPDCINTSLIGIIHGYIANAAQFSLIFSPLFLFRVFKEDSRWNNYWIFSVLMFIFGLIFALIYKINIFEEHIGLLQRISFGLPLIWTEIIAIKLFSLNYKK
jgi:hypothetical membrane protein